jgi:hypothetical protein
MKKRFLVTVKKLQKEVNLIHLSTIICEKILFNLLVAKAFSRVTILLTYSLFTSGAILDSIKSL